MKEKRKIGEDEKEKIREKMVEQNLKSEAALEEKVSEQIVLCGDLILNRDGVNLICKET